MNSKTQQDIPIQITPEMVAQNSQPGCKVQRYASSENKMILPYSRRDYFKIWIVNGESMLHYANKSIHITQPALIFSNPLVPYSFERISEHMSGYLFIFNNDFLKSGPQQESMVQSPLFQVGHNSVFFLNEEQLLLIYAIYDKMIAEIDGDYLYKYDVIRNYGSLLVHEAMKMQPALSAFRHHNATARIANLFIELLERQFPIDSPDRILKLKKPSDYAVHLSVHVNHLNYAVREITGKPTSAHIAERILNEAKALLKNTSWSVSDIAYSLGFEYPTYFNNFFKKNTGVTPLSLRK